MELFFHLTLFVFWTLFGSFASVLIYRIKSWESGILAWRSHCKNCDRDLSAFELVPIFSWLFQEWKCKWCKQKISAIYPLLEISTGILFTLVWVFLINSSLIFTGDVWEWLRLIFFSMLMFLTIVYVFYDILYLEIPESILLWANILTLWALILQWYWFAIFPYLSIWWLDTISLILSLWIIAALYTIMLTWLREIWDCIILMLCIWVLAGYFILYVPYGFYSWNPVPFTALLSGSIAALWIFISFFLQIVLSRWRAMWWWDLRIAILMWLIVGTWFAFPAWMICYLIGSIIGIIIILRSKIKNWISSQFQHQVPFGPFIASWYLTVLFFFPEISKFIEWYL